MTTCLVTGMLAAVFGTLSNWQQLQVSSFELTPISWWRKLRLKNQSDGQAGRLQYTGNLGEPDEWRQWRWLAVFSVQYMRPTAHMRLAVVVVTHCTYAPCSGGGDPMHTCAMQLWRWPTARMRHAVVAVTHCSHTCRKMGIKIITANTSHRISNNVLSSSRLYWSLEAVMHSHRAVFTDHWKQSCTVIEPSL